VHDDADGRDKLSSAAMNGIAAAVAALAVGGSECLTRRDGDGADVFTRKTETVTSILTEWHVRGEKLKSDGNEGMSKFSMAHKR
jgi:hypothetical protein